MAGVGREVERYSGVMGGSSEARRGRWAVQFCVRTKNTIHTVTLYWSTNSNKEEVGAFFGGGPPVRCTLLLLVLSLLSKGLLALQAVVGTDSTVH